MFCEKLQNLCSLAANPDQMDKNGCDFWTQHPTKPLQTSSPQKSCIPVNRIKRSRRFFILGQVCIIVDHIFYISGRILVKLRENHLPPHKVPQIGNAMHVSWRHGRAWIGNLHIPFFICCEGVQ